MRKKVGIVFILGMTLFLLFYHRVNAGKPKDLEVKRYDFGEKISYEDIDFTVEKGQIINQDGLDLLPIIYTIKNEGDKKIDASDLILRIFYRNGLSNDEICQNVVEPNVNLDPDEFSYKKIYQVDDFIMNPGEEKTFELYYNIEKTYYEKYPSCLKFPNSMYWNKYRKKLEDGTFYYEILEWNNKWDILIWEL